MNKIMALLLVLMLMAGCVAIAACGDGDDGDETGETSWQQPGEQDTTPAGSGEFTWADVPVYPGADEEESFSMATSVGQDEDFDRIEWRYYSTGDSMDDVASFYEGEMPGSGWNKVMAMDMGEMWYGYWEKNNGNTGAYIGVVEEGGETMLWMWRGQGADGDGGSVGGEIPEETTPVETSPSTGGDVPAPGEVDPLNFERLIPALPAVPSGWDGGDPYGMTMTGMGGYAYTLVDRDYDNISGGERVNVTIYDSAYYDGFAWFQLYDESMFFNYQTSDGYAKTTSFNGYQAWEIYDKPDDYTRVILVAERFVVFVQADTKASLDQFSNAVDYNALEGLA
ncbi:MAG: hypothetical protein R6U89_02625 [Dehalococcoidia bacterium]